MKIVFIATQWQSPWAGSEELWWEAARVSLERGHEVAVVSFAWPDMHPRIRALQERGARILQRTRPIAGMESRSVLAPWLRKLRFERFRIWAPLASWKPDAICISQGGTYDLFENGMPVKFSVEHNIPFMILCQWNSEDLAFNHGPASIVAAECFSRAKVVAFVSERNLRVTERQIAGELPNASVVLNPVNLKIFDPVPYPGPGAVKLANVARHDAQCKGQDVLLHALSGDDWKNRRWRLRLYGSGPDRPYLEHLAEHYGLADRVEFLGHVSDIRSIWADNHILVMPSRSEGTPLALVEAMICARPSVVTDVGGQTEWVEDAVTGFIAEAPSVRSLDGALSRAWNARDRWESMGDRAHEVAMSRFNPDPGGAILSMLMEIGTAKARPPVYRDVITR